MANRILDLSEEPGRLCIRHRNLVVEVGGHRAISVPVKEIAVIVVSHPQVRFTHAVLSSLADSGGVFVTCGANRLPVGMMLPLAAHFAQVERFAAQSACPKPIKKRLWQQLVRAKIRAQARLIAELHGEDFGLGRLVSEVHSGDSTNVEARAARRYWQLLFAENEFRRDRNAVGENQLLNYGYAVLRAIVARAICSAGLHPGLGLHHHNRYSSFPLADDLMEPLRPMVDGVKCFNGNETTWRSC